MDIKHKIVVWIVVLCYAQLSAAQNNEHKKQLSDTDFTTVAKVWSGHPAGFDLLTSGKYQYICYYDSERNMAIAQRTLGSAKWKTTLLPSVLGWDSHNYIKMAVDDKGYIHVSGNMHAVPLIYFRSLKPESIDSFERLPMTGIKESEVTYPMFFKDASGKLYFQYRDGKSGEGNILWNVYDSEHKKWSSLFDVPLFDGEKEASAYTSGPTLGPDGYFHFIWMWRATYIANTNHNLSYIRSKDLIHWENIKGDPIALPVKWRNTSAVVDPVGPWNGLINMDFQLNWDNFGTPYISYHKYDANGISQVFIARWEKTVWKIYQVSNWPGYTWDLNRGGSLINEVGISSVKFRKDHTILVAYHHKKFGTGSWLLKEETMAVITHSENKLPVIEQQPGELSADNEMIMHVVADNTGKYIMKWQTLPVNQDAPRPLPYPAPSDLIIYKIPEAANASRR